ncbi:hypothetical protein TA3x_003428 [Tundrisphaera sp. TA3]|uniref:hypothetical protein n=1 Tax=Tundrisphaera sp. TA3 TaxID=3435775 RepID=UPI003EBDF36F
MSESMTPPGVEQGPSAPNRLKLDARGRALPRTDEERAADAERIRELVEILKATPPDDPPGETEAFMRAIDSHRPDRPLFEGYY